jgi:hypothetical protein
MTVAELVARIKNLGHDKAMPDEYVYQFIDNAIRDIERYGTFSYQDYTETVTVQANSTLVPTKYNVIKVISIYGLDTDAYYVKNGKLYLTSAPSTNTQYKVRYILKHPIFDGSETNRLINNDTVLLYGGVYYLMLHNQDPATAIYREMFFNELDKYYQADIYNKDLEDETDWFPNIDSLGI